MLMKYYPDAVSKLLIVRRGRYPSAHHLMAAPAPLRSSSKESVRGIVSTAGAPEMKNILRSSPGEATMSLIAKAARSGARLL